MVLERLQNALDDCIRIEAGSLRLCDRASVASQAGQRDITVQAVLSTFANIEPLDKYFERIAKSIIAKLVQPLLASETASIALIAQDDHSSTLRLDNEETRTPEDKLASLRALLQAARSRIFSDKSSIGPRSLFFGLLIPPIQELVKTHILEASIPLSADPFDLSRYQAICQAVNRFEEEELGIEAGITPLLAGWSVQAGSHWAQAVIQRSFSQLRMDIVPSDYWNKTETIEWEEQDPQTVVAQPVVENGDHTVSEPEVALPSHSSIEVPAKTKMAPAYAAEAEDLAPEEDAWGLDDDVEEKAVEPITQAAPTIRKNIIPESPDPNAEDAWGFDAGEEEEPPIASTSTAASASAMVTNGGGSDVEEDAGGWSFDDEADEIASVGSSRKTYSRKASIEEGWDAWTKPEDEQALRPIGKPTKVVSGRLGGGKAATVSTPEAEERAETPTASTSQIVQAPKLSIPLKVQDSTPAVSLPKIKENMLVSTRSRRVLEIAEQSLQAAIAVLTTR